MLTQMKKLGLGAWILIAMVLGIIVGLLMGESASMFGPIGDIFVSLIKMVVIPLVAFSIIGGAASIGNSKSAGKVGVSTFAYYLATTAFAVALGLLFGEVFKPGTGLDMSRIQDMFSMEYADKGDIAGFFETINGIIPTNPIASLVDGNMLQILFFCVFLGFGVASLNGDRKKAVLDVVNGFSDALVFVILKAMYVAPLGVFALMASATGTFGYEVLGLVVKLLAVYVVALLIHTFVVYGTLVKVLGKMSPRYFFSRISKAQLVALSTASSMATLPITTEICEEDLEVSKETASFVLPLGATINMDGNAVYYALAACFFAQMFGIDLGISQYVAIILAATVGSIGQAGVPGPSLLVVAVLIAAGIPVEGLPLLIGADRLFDMLRTAVNITGDATCAVFVDRIAKEAK